MPPVSTAPQPECPTVMFQRWRDLLFLHWEVGAAEIQKTLPEGLQPDLWEGRAYVGLVPFFMQRVRPRGLPCVPGISDFLELNVRTYVKDRHGRTGVWFYSLDCNQALAVLIARTLFALPYFHAKMSARTTPEGIAYKSLRRDTSKPATLTYASAGPASRAEAGSFEEFLVERYRLFSARGRTLLTGRVWHHPYDISPASFSGEWRAPLALAGFDTGDRPPVHAVFSRGVEVRVYPMETV